MNRSLFVFCIALMAAPCLYAQSPPEPLRNTFITATESVLDQAALVDLRGSEAAVTAQMQNLNTSLAKLTTMAYGEREENVVAAVKDVLFVLSACRIQSVDGTSTAACETKLAAARTRAMDELGQHKTAHGWEAAPPS